VNRDERLTAAERNGEELVGAIVAHEWNRIASLFEPDAQFRAVVPQKNPFRDRQGPDEIALQFQRWFGDADVTELLESTVERIADRVRVSYRIHEHEPDGWYLVEQQAYLTPRRGDRVSESRLLRLPTYPGLRLVSASRAASRRTSGCSRGRGRCSRRPAGSEW
jgi:hypothetical protein